MNIFYLDHDHTTCAKYHNDKHCVKMILEYAQLLCTAHRELDGDDCMHPDVLYKSTHKNQEKWTLKNNIETNTIKMVTWSHYDLKLEKVTRVGNIFKNIKIKDIFKMGHQAPTLSA